MLQNRRKHIVKFKNVNICALVTKSLDHTSLRTLIRLNILMTYFNELHLLVTPQSQKTLIT